MKSQHIIGLFLFSGMLAGCGGGGGSTSSTPTPSTQTGTLQVSLTDAPACGFDQVNVTVSKIRVHQSSSASDTDGGWQDIALATPVKINLLNLTNGVLQTLGNTTLPAGQYTQIRLVLVPNSASQPLNESVVPTGGTETALKTPSAIQTGIKIIRPFTVEPGTQADLVLDFNACKSIVQTGNGGYLLKPVVSATPLVVSGTISGYLAPAISNATVYAEQGGSVIRATIPDSTGKFVLYPLEQSSSTGNYDVVVVAPGYATGVLRAVPVSAKTNTSVSTSNQPVNLNTSSTATLSGTVSPASAEATVSALQTLSSGTKIETASQEAAESTGNYSMTLPVVAPSAGTYSSSLPITLSPDNSAAGQYQVRASAEGYIAQTQSANMSTGNLTQNFTLTK